MRYRTDANTVQLDDVYLNFVTGEYSHNFTVIRPQNNTFPGLATTYNAQGEIEVCPPNTLRIIHDPITGECLGAAVEASMQNFASSPDFWGREAAKNANDTSAAVTANTNTSMYESPELNINTLVSEHGNYRNMKYADVWFTGTSNTNANLNLVMTNSLGNFPNATFEFDGTLGYIPKTGNLVFSRTTEAYTYDWTTRLTRLKVNQPKFIYDVTKDLNLVVNPWGDGGVPFSTTLPPHYNAIAGGLTIQFMGRGTYEDGLPYTEWLITGVSNGVAQNFGLGCRGWPSATPLAVQASPNEGVWSAQSFIEVLDNSGIIGGTSLSFWLGSLNSSGTTVISNGWSTTIPRQTYNVRSLYQHTNRALINSQTAGAELAIRLSPAVSELVNVRFRVCAPILTRTATQITDTTSVYTVMARTPVPSNCIGVQLSPNTALTNNAVWNNVSIIVSSTNTTFRGEAVYQIMEPNTAVNARRLELTGAGLVNATNNYTYTTTFYIKPINLNYFNFSTTSTAGSASLLATFSFEEGLIRSLLPASTPLAEIQYIEDGWYQVIVSTKASATGTLGILIGTAPEKNTARTETFAGDPERGFYITTPRIYDDVTVYPYAMQTPTNGLLGLHLETASTNELVNPLFLGAVPGQINSTTAGSLFFSNTHGLFLPNTANLVCTLTPVTEAGLQCVDINITGTPTTNNQFVFTLGNAAAGNTTANNQMAFSAYVRASSPTTSNLLPVFRVQEVNANTYTPYEIVIPVITSNTVQSIVKSRQSIAKTIINANTTGIQGFIVMWFNTGHVNMNVTFRVAAPQLEKKAFNTFFMANATGQSAFTSGRDVFESNGRYIANTEVSYSLRLMLPFYNVQSNSTHTWGQGTIFWIGTTSGSDSDCIRVINGADVATLTAQRRRNAILTVSTSGTANVRDQMMGISATFSVPSYSIAAFSNNAGSGKGYTVTSSVGSAFALPTVNMKFMAGQNVSAGVNIILNKARVWSDVAMSNSQVVSQANRIT